MFELFAVFAVLGGVALVFVAAIAVLKLTLSLVLLPFKLLAMPVAAIGGILKITFVLVAGLVMVTMAGAILLPLAILALTIAVPVAIIAALA